ncbi:MAG: aspartate-semialdehyde dehydrogenase, partial [Planctomycetota bacterium]
RDTTIPYAGGRLQVRPFDKSAPSDCAAALLCTPAEVSREIAPALERAGMTTVDCSSAFRHHPDVPLVVPEINGRLLTGPARPRLVANPNCSTIMLLIAIEPARRAFGLRSLTVSTYQAVSGAGQAAIEELSDESARLLSGEPPAPTIFPTSCAFNVFPHESPRDPGSGYCEEEIKMIRESQRILDDRTLEVLPNCIRVPVARCHSQAIVIETGRDASAEEIGNLVREYEHADYSPGTTVTPRDTERTDRVRLGRARASISNPARKFMLWACCDQLRKGAALNAIQILDRLDPQ